MKKVLMSMAILALATQLMAIDLPTSKFTITATSVGGGNDEVAFYEGPSATFTTGYDNGYDAAKNFNTANPSINVNIYAATAWGNASKLAVPENTLEGQWITFQPNTSETEYTFTFSKVSLKADREELYFKDVTENKLIKITTTMEPYVFTITEAEKTAHKAITNRFQIVGGFKPCVGCDLDICHQYGALTINANPYEGNIVIKDAAGTTVKDVKPMPTPQSISLSDLTAGQYTVVLGAGAKELIIKVQ